MKAQRYVEEMVIAESDDWQHALWSGLALELLARAALANVSPVLLADTSEKGVWSHIYYALGFQPLEQAYSPRSIKMNEVVKRLGAIIPNFKEVGSFCIVHTGRRNAELHSGETPFDGVAADKWQPQFYQACDALLASMGMQLNDLFDEDRAKLGKALIEAAADKAAKNVLSDIAAHQKVWGATSPEEQEKDRDIAAVWATRTEGHRVACPACGSTALVFGEPCAAAKQVFEDGEITETQEHLPSHFQCVACKLKINGLSQLTAAGLGDRFKTTRTYDAATFYGAEDEYAHFEDDNNEP